MEIKDLLSVGASILNIAKPIIELLKPKSVQAAHAKPNTISVGPRRFRFRRTVEEWEIYSEDRWEDSSNGNLDEEKPQEDKSRST